MIRRCRQRLTRFLRHDGPGVPLHHLRPDPAADNAQHRDDDTRDWLRRQRLIRRGLRNQVHAVDGRTMGHARVPESSSGAVMKPRITSLAPQFLVDDLARSIAYYRKLGFTFGEPWDGFYAIGQVDGLELHLKEAPKNADERRHRRANEHLDAAAGVDGIEAFHAQCVANGATIIRPLAPTPWGTKDFYVEDPDGYVVCFGGRPTAD